MKFKCGAISLGVAYGMRFNDFFAIILILSSRGTESVSNESIEAGKIFENFINIRDNWSKNETESKKKWEMDSYDYDITVNLTLKQTEFPQNIAAGDNIVDFNPNGTDFLSEIWTAKKDNLLNETKFQKTVDFVSDIAEEDEVSQRNEGQRGFLNSTDNVILINGNKGKPMLTKTLEINSEKSSLEDQILEDVLNRISTDLLMEKLKALKKGHSSEEAEDLEELIVWTSVVDSVNKWKKRKDRKRVKRDEEIVCYQELGCFRDVGFFDYLDTLPESPEYIDTRFILHTPDSNEYGEIIDYKNASSLYYSRFMNLAPIKVIVHGFGGGGTKRWVIDMKNALLKSGNFNVIVVDWERGSDLPNYVQAAANTKLVGKQLSLLMEMINSQRGKTNEDYHIIGFSLGAHIAGFTGMYSKNISRITGLDPAAPLFEGYEDNNRLDVTDAHFVDIIHSSAERLLFGGLGAYERMGDVDYYPNGGKSQAGCTNLILGAISDIFYGDWKSLCNHRRAYQMFTESITPHCPFPSFACDSFEHFINGKCFPCHSDDQCGNMGFYADQTKGRGQLYLVTRENKPFCANQYMIEVNSSSENKLTWGKLEVTLITSGRQNETFLLTEESDEIKPGKEIRKVIVAHPKLKNITNIQIKYTQYDGWLYDGKTVWVVDAISLIDSNGLRLHYCGFPVKLRSSHAVSLPVDKIQCIRKTSIQLGLPASPIITIKKSQRQGRMRWVHQAKRRFPYPFYVPHETVVISRLSSQPRNHFLRRPGRMMRARPRFSKELPPQSNLQRLHQDFRWRGMDVIPR